MNGLNKGFLRKVIKMMCQTPGQTLHAKILGIIHPRTSQYMEFNAELPDYFKHLLEIL